MKAERKLDREVISHVVRPATLADIPGMHRVRLAVRENRLTSNRINEASYVPELTVTGRGWVAESDGVITGFAIGNLQTGNIWALFVDPDSEGQGVGGRLHDVMMAGMLAHGLARLHLGTASGTRAERFYLARGWKPTGMDGGDVMMELGREAVRCGGGMNEHRFNIFGMLVLIRGTVGAWEAFYPGPDGKRRPADFIVPHDIAEADLLEYLADLFHEHATPRNHSATQLPDNNK